MQATAEAPPRRFSPGTTARRASCRGARRPGRTRAPDPYRVWLSEVMLQQTTVAAVRGYFAAFVTRWPTVADLAAAADAEVMAAWAGLGYYARARNLLACARAVARERGGRFPTTEAELAGLPGIGAYTAAAIAAIAFDRPAVVVDGNVERVMARLFAVEDPLPAAKPRLRALAAGLTPAARPGDYAQAVMDLGATLCTPRAPPAASAPGWPPAPAAARGSPPELPRRSEKPARPVRHGTAWLALRADGAVLVETRPPRGLLGGMLGLPVRPLGRGTRAGAAPVPADWRDRRRGAPHLHPFPPRPAPRAARVPAGFSPPAAPVPPRRRPARALPSVMRKALRLGLSALA